MPPPAEWWVGTVPGARQWCNLLYSCGISVDWVNMTGGDVDRYCDGSEWVGFI